MATEIVFSPDDGRRMTNNTVHLTTPRPHAQRGRTAREERQHFYRPRPRRLALQRPGSLAPLLSRSRAAPSRAAAVAARHPRRPLAAAEVIVEEIEDNPGYYQAKFFLRPHFQLEGLTVSLRMVAKLPSLKDVA